jgi:SHS2 domain-containing protein
LKDKNIKKYMPYKIAQHTADIGLELSGKKIEEIFESALLGMMNILNPIKISDTIIKREIKVESVDISSLIVDFLNEVLYFCNTENEFYDKIKFKEISDNNLIAELRGKKCGGFGEDIKATTYHGVKIEKEKDNFRVNVIFDV